MLQYKHKDLKQEFTLSFFDLQEQIPTKAHKCSDRGLFNLWEWNATWMWECLSFLMFSFSIYYNTNILFDKKKNIHLCFLFMGIHVTYCLLFIFLQPHFVCGPAKTSMHHHSLWHQSLSRIMCKLQQYSVQVLLTVFFGERVCFSILFHISVTPYTRALWCQPFLSVFVVDHSPSWWLIKLS